MAGSSYCHYRQLSIDLSPPILSEEGFVETLLWRPPKRNSYGLEVNVQMEWNSSCTA